MIEAGFITAIGIIWILCRFDLKKVAGMATFIDIGVFIILPVLFIGTYAGMMTGMLTGVIISLFLTILRKTTNPISLRLIRLHGERFPRFRWVNTSK